MEETILNIYLEIIGNSIVAYRGIAYQISGSDDEKISFLTGRAPQDFNSAYRFDAPADNHGKFMTWKSFEKLRKRNMEINLFEEIFQEFNVPKEPLILVTPVIDGVIKSA